jgi:hypothetical protein
MVASVNRVRHPAKDAATLLSRGQQKKPASPAVRLAGSSLSVASTATGVPFAGFQAMLIEENHVGKQEKWTRA